MTKKALIYTRVSTEEQGSQFSLPDQKARLERFCILKDIEVVAHYREEHSAKNFEDRKVFQQLLTDAKRQRKQIDYVLFVRWDRFSRNVTQSFEMIRRLADLGIEANAVEGWIDHSVPENLLMLAFYLASPEVENTRRGLNVKRGLRQAVRQGRFPHRAPKGYKNGRDDQNKPLCMPDNTLTKSGHSVAELVTMAFEEYGRGHIGIVELTQKYHRLGLKLQRSAMSNMLRSPFYMGKIYLEAWKDEKAGLYTGLHEPIITPEIFYKVQNVLNGNRPHMKPSDTVREQLPLRGLLACPKCGKTLTGSGSRSRNGDRHFYYHCREGCKMRLRADKLDQMIIALLKDIKPTQEALELYVEILKEATEQRHWQQQQQRTTITKQINTLQEKLGQLEEKFITDQITITVYQKWQGKYTTDLADLKDQQRSITQNLKSNLSAVSASLPLLSNLDHYYAVGTATFKNKLIRIIFTDKITPENPQGRTAPIHPIIAQISQPRAILNRQTQNTAPSDSMVRHAGFEPATPTLSR